MSHLFLWWSIWAFICSILCPYSLRKLLAFKTLFSWFKAYQFALFCYSFSSSSCFLSLNSIVVLFLKNIKKKDRKIRRKNFSSLCVHAWNTKNNLISVNWMWLNNSLALCCCLPIYTDDDVWWCCCYCCLCLPACLPACLQHDHVVNAADAKRLWLLLLHS